jgi:hypothetical protein
MIFDAKHGHPRAPLSIEFIDIGDDIEVFAKVRTRVSEFVYWQANLLFHSVNFLACHAWTFVSRRSLLVILRVGRLCRTLYYDLRGEPCVWAVLSTNCVEALLTSMYVVSLVSTATTIDRRHENPRGDYLLLCAMHCSFEHR